MIGDQCTEARSGGDSLVHSTAMHCNALVITNAFSGKNFVKQWPDSLDVQWGRSLYTAMLD